MKRRVCAGKFRWTVWVNQGLVSGSAFDCLDVRIVWHSCQPLRYCHNGEYSALTFMKKTRR
jgi:hypothetical protein